MSRPHRIFGRISAGLFALFVVAGIVALTHSWPSRSCAGVTPTHNSGDTVEIAGPGWSGGIKSTDCVEIASVSSNGTKHGYSLGSAPSVHTGSAWTDIRWAEAGWIAWTAAMMLLAFAVASIPGLSPLESMSRAEGDNSTSSIGPEPDRASGR